MKGFDFTGKLGSPMVLERRVGQFESFWGKVGKRGWNKSKNPPPPPVPDYFLSKGFWSLSSYCANDRII